MTEFITVTVMGAIAIASGILLFGWVLGLFTADRMIDKIIKKQFGPPECD